MKLWICLILLLVSYELDAQSYSYEYSDPCTGETKTITVPINGSVMVSYYGESAQFSDQDFYNGTFTNWTNSVIAKYDNVSPCSQTIGVSTVIGVGQSQVINSIAIVNSIAALSDIAGSTNILAGATGTLNGSSTNEKNDNKNEKDKGSSNKNTSTSGTSTSGSEGGQTSSGGSESSSGGSGETGGGTGSGGKSVGEKPNGGAQAEAKETPEPKTETEESGSTNITAGGTNTIKSSTTGGSSNRNRGNGDKPSVVLSGDVVAFNFKNSDLKRGIKTTSGYTALSWDGKRSWGALGDYTSSINGPNVTAFYAWLKNKNIALMSATLTVGFQGKGSIYGTFSGGYMYSFKKVKKLKLVALGTASFGQVFRTPFIGTAAIGGGMYDFQIGKRIGVKMAGLLVYSPYVSYYNDMVLKSPFVILPSTGVNLAITKKFKFNLNMGGAWSYDTDKSKSTLNYTITCGTRLLIGGE